MLRGSSGSPSLVVNTRPEPVQASPAGSPLAYPYGLSFDSGMANVAATGEARDALHQIAKRFDAGQGEPVYFGSHRRAQGVIVPVEIWERLLEQAEEELDLEFARDRLAHDDGRRLSRDEIDAVFDQLRAGRSA